MRRFSAVASLRLFDSAGVVFPDGAPVFRVPPVPFHRDPGRPGVAWWKLAECMGSASSDPCLGLPSPSLPQPDPFFPERGEKDEVAKARELCEKCFVRLHCLIDGLREQFGVWGGLTVEEREVVRRKVRAAHWQPGSVDHRMPAGWCLDCGSVTGAGDCPEPGSGRHDPFALYARYRRRVELPEEETVPLGEALGTL